MSSLKTNLSIYNFKEIMAESIEFIWSFPKNDKDGEKFKVEIKTHKKENVEKKPKTLLLFCKNKDENNQSKNSVYYYILYYVDKNQFEIFELHLQNITAMTWKELPFANSHNMIMAYGTYHGSIILHFFSNKNQNSGKKWVRELEKIHSYKVNCLELSVVDNDKTILLASGSNDRKIIISTILAQNFESEENIKIENLYKFV